MLPDHVKGKRRLVFLAFLTTVPLYVLASFSTGIIMGELLLTTSMLGLFLFFIEGMEMIVKVIQELEMKANTYNLIAHLDDMEGDDNGKR